MLTKEQVAEVLRQSPDLVEGRDYTISPSNRSIVSSQIALDILIGAFGVAALQEVEGPTVFTKVQADY